MMMASSWRIALAAELNVLDRDDPGSGYERARFMVSFATGLAARGIDATDRMRTWVRVR
jgi:hypothetical protein